MSKMIALTGVTGFIGGALIRRLTLTGRQVRALIRPASSQKRPAAITADWIDGDLADMESLRRLVHGVEAVVHCAGAVRGATRAQFNRVNIDGVARLVRAAAAQKPAPRFLLISSIAARQPELSYYAASKRIGEKILTEKSDKLAWTVFRPSAVYGPGDRELLPVFRWIEKGIAPIIGSGNRRFSMLYVKDLADAVLQWIDHGGCHADTFELHDGHPDGYSWHDVIETVQQLRSKPVVPLKIPVVIVKLIATLNLLAARALGYAPMLTPGKVRELTHADWVCDNTKYNSVTGWKPRILLAEGLNRILYTE